MKFIKAIIAVLFFTFIFTVSTFAQSSSLSIVAIQYSTRDDIDFLFANSTQVLEYLDGEEIPKPIFLSLVTDKQVESIKAKGYALTVLQQNADLDRFVLLYNPEINQSDKLQSFGDPIAIAPNYTLLKMPEGKKFTHEGEGGRFFEIPFSTIISPPPLRTKTAAEVEVSHEKPSSTNGLLAIVILIVLVIGITGVVGFIIWRRKNSAV